MPQKITLGHKKLVEDAEKEIETIPTREAFALVGRDDTLLLVCRQGAIECRRK